ncbi:MAG: APC family permease [Gemmatimonadota bacterium]
MERALPEARDAWGERLPRTLGPRAFVAVLISLTIGSGIFGVPAGIASELRSPGAILAIWVLGGALALAGALSLAELGAAFPRSGGYFVALAEAWGPLPAFAYGWAELIVIAPSGLGAVSFICAQYLAYFVPLSPTGIRIAAAVVVLLCTFFAYRGVRLAAAVAGASTYAKYTGLILLVVLAVTIGRGSPGNFAPLWSVGFSFGGFLTALLAVMFTYDGWGDGLRLAGEVQDPARNIARGMTVAVSLIALIYVAVNAAYLYLLPVDELARSPLVAADAAERIPLLGAAAGSIAAVLVMVSTFGCVAGSALVYPRTQYAMADRGLFFQVVGRISPRFRTPSVATWIVGTLAIAFIFIGDFQRLANQFVLGLWPFYTLAVAGVFVLRRRRPELERPYRVWGYPVVPAFFVVVGLLLMINALVASPGATGMTFGLLLAGVPVYWVWRALAGRR